MIFDADFHKVKLIDFGMTRKCGSYVRRLVGSIPYSPPEVCTAVNNDVLVSTTMDVWAFGVLLFCCLTGKQTRGEFSRLDRLLLQATFPGNTLKSPTLITTNIYNGIDGNSSSGAVSYRRNGTDSPLV